MTIPAPNRFAETPARLVDGEERLAAPGGGMALFMLRPGDAIRITDGEGLQPGALFLLPRADTIGAVAPALSAHADATLHPDAEMLALLDRAGGGEGDLARLTGYRLFSADGRAGSGVAPLRRRRQPRAADRCRAVSVAAGRTTLRDGFLTVSCLCRRPPTRR